MEVDSDGGRPRAAGRATVYDVAALAGVSIKTVSRVANGESQVSPSTRRKVQDAMEHLSYVRNPAARALASGSGPTIGVVIDSIADHFFSSLVLTVEERAIATGVAVSIGSTGRSPERERAQIERLVQQNVSGLIIASSAGDHSYVEQVAAGVPVVLIDRGWELPGYDTVRVQDHEAARAATAHLVEHGHRRIAFLGESIEVETVAARRSGYRQALQDNGIRFDTGWVNERCPDVGAADVEVRRMLAGRRPPTAIFASSPRAAMGAVSALHALGRTDVALVSFGDFELAGSLVPAVTVVDHSPHELGEAAMSTLFARMADRARPAVDLALPLKMIARGSGELTPRDVLPGH
ncbi:LacI family DNA-binding transcriptional regulator [Nakamurella alba]|uniref:LacI family DNA-binding transcriptional regulator n=1 Tax=Nakamurella alba TaxID=2665158 RepID=UPI0018AB282C|nr:LacI family DNA-binding transcriptional regulator [Nakamurella alba]